MEGRATVIIYCSPPPLSTPADQAEVSIQHSLHNATVLPWIDSSCLPGFQVSYPCQNGLKKTLFLFISHNNHILRHQHGFVNLKIFFFARCLPPKVFYVWKVSAVGFWMIAHIEMVLSLQQGGYLVIQINQRPRHGSLDPGEQETGRSV